MFGYFFTEKQTVTLALNNANSAGADLFFKYYTYAAEWIVIVLPLLLGVILKKFDFFIAVVIVFILEALIVNGLKNFVFQNTPRPVVEFDSQLHHISGVVLHQWQSFPSGHTAASVLGFGLLAQLFSNKYIQVSFVVLALLIGYSRMYLGLHFLRDVCGGMSISLMLLWFFPYLQNIIANKLTHKK